MRFQYSSLVTLSVTLLAFSANAVPLGTDTSPSSPLQKRSHGDCSGDPRCQAWMGANFKALVASTFRDGVNYDYLVQRSAGEYVVAYACDNSYPGKLGQDIRNMFTYGLYDKAGCKACGYWYLDDAGGCKVKANYCIGCASIG
ncbi:hypothetical protein P153DRAFT_352941 [Dothidotthia symphoricarpi CBS 119687]|uniref:Uncharacterized protein n=1 Tax=Dothidotthia symphoricarpi CBS 119687 TaxID=1392245 RepID=A0A6A6AQ51_9PLEO|nr:uncharacterized protein P153DRAFT_352941 [Dothidotthia symphoricarpi CBS 119687]KAF2133666.1 hypothetical protein P153DRAFT_352941 [Dothidotthia symphoricarpi CBS 119687]